MVALISPVKAPPFSQYMFCAPSFTFCTSCSASLAFDSDVNGGTITTSTSADSPISRRKVSMKVAVSVWVMFIFQFAATIFLRGERGFEGAMALKLEVDERRVVRRNEYEHERAN